MRFVTMHRCYCCEYLVPSQAMFRRHQQALCEKKNATSSCISIRHCIYAAGVLMQRPQQRNINKMQGYPAKYLNLTQLMWHYPATHWVTDDWWKSHYTGHYLWPGFWDCVLLLFRWPLWQLQVPSLCAMTARCLCLSAQVFGGTETQRKRRQWEQRGQRRSRIVSVGLTLYSGWTLVSRWCLLICLDSTAPCCGPSAAKPCGCSCVCRQQETLQEASTSKTTTGGSKSCTRSAKLQRRVRCPVKLTVWTCLHVLQHSL